MAERKIQLQGESNSPYGKLVTAGQYEDYRAEIEREKEAQMEFEDMKKKYGLTEMDFIRAMEEREASVAEWQLNPEAFEYQENDSHGIPVSWVMERLYRDEARQEKIAGFTKKFLKEIIEKWNKAVKENLENEREI